MQMQDALGACYIHQSSRFVLFNQRTGLNLIFKNGTLGPEDPRVLIFSKIRPPNLVTSTSGSRVRFLPSLSCFVPTSFLLLRMLYVAIKVGGSSKGIFPTSSGMKPAKTDYATSWHFYLVVAVTVFWR